MSNPNPVSPPQSWGRTTLVAIGLSLIAGVILLAFGWPAVTASPKDLPIALVGNDAQVAQLGASLAQQGDDAIEIVRLDNRAAAVDAIKQRQVYGAIVLPTGPGQPPEVLKATAASPAVGQLLDGVAGQLQAQLTAQLLEAAQAGKPVAPVQVTVTDVVPLADSDPRGAGLAAALFPMVLAGVIGGTGLSLLVRRGGLRLAVTVLSYAASAGLLLAGLLQGVFGALQGSFIANAAAVALTIAAITGTITGLWAWLGRPGLGVGAGFMMLVANPLSAATVPVEFILAPWGQVGQWLPPGAGATLIRNLSYFPDASSAGAWWVLVIWSVLGITATGFQRAARRSAAAPEVSATTPSEAHPSADPLPAA